MSLETEIGKISIRNPLILASGVLGVSYSTLQRVYTGGLGAVVTKSIGIKSRKGNPNPSVFALDDIRSVINSVGLANPGYQAYRQDIEVLVKNQVPVIVSIFGETKEEFSEVLNGLKELPILAFELNLSCPNTEKGGIQMGTDADVVYQIVSKLRSLTKIPLWIKLTPNVTDIIEIAEAAVNAGCDCLVAINTLKAMVIDIHTKMPVLGFKRGGLSGAAIKPIGIRFIYDLYEHFEGRIPLIGVGGIRSGEDVIEYLLAGSSAVQIGTALGVAYPENMIKFFLNRIKKYMKEQGFRSISEITGGAHK
ncbi:MAG: dihydroorotate dehydrogenase [Candidatus Heimdallarchaeaceae archaeon]